MNEAIQTRRTPLQKAELTAAGRFSGPGFGPGGFSQDGRLIKPDTLGV